MFERYKFTVSFEADRDSVPGWGNKPEDWIDLAVANFCRQTHYHTMATVLTLDSAKTVYNEETKKREATEFAPLDFATTPALPPSCSLNLDGLIKPLEWEVDSIGNYYAETVTGRFFLMKIEYSNLPGVVAWLNEDTGQEFDNLEEAQKACWETYTSDIRSTLNI